MNKDNEEIESGKWRERSGRGRSRGLQEKAGTEQSQNKKETEEEEVGKRRQKRKKQGWGWECRKGNTCAWHVLHSTWCLLIRPNCSHSLLFILVIAWQVASNSLIYMLHIHHGWSHRVTVFTVTCDMRIKSILYFICIRAYHFKKWRFTVFSLNDREGLLHLIFELFSSSLPISIQKTLKRCIIGEKKFVVTFV